MKKTPYLCVAVLIMLCSAVEAADLYSVTLQSDGDARALPMSDADPVVRMDDDYLVLATVETCDKQATDGLVCRLLARDVHRKDLAVDTRRDTRDKSMYSPVYEQNDVRLVSIPYDKHYTFEIRGDFLSLAVRTPTMS